MASFPARQVPVNGATNAGLAAAGTRDVDATIRQAQLDVRLCRSGVLSRHIR